MAEKMKGAPSGTTTVVVLCSPRDLSWRDRLKVHLRPLERTRALTLWDDSVITPGAVLAAETQQALASAATVILLLSADLLASDGIMKEQLPLLLERSRQDSLRLLPLLVSPCNYEDTELGRLQPFNYGTGVTWLLQMTSDQQEMSLRRVVQLIAGADPEAADEAGTERLAWVKLQSRSIVARQQIATLTHAKTIHDLLHRVQFQVYGPVVAEEPRFPEEASVERIEDAAEEFRKLLKRLRAHEPEMMLLGDILVDLEGARSILQQALVAQDGRLLRKAKTAIRRVLQRYPPRVAGEIDSAVRILSFDYLKEHGCTQVAALHAVVSELAQLGAELRFLSERHSVWQKVEDELLAADAVLGSRDEEILDSHYPETRRLFGLLCDAYSKAPSALLLEEGCLEEADQHGTSLEAALDKGDTSAVRRCFSRYRKALGKCFFNADDKLLKHCNQLQQAATKLNSILDSAEVESTQYA